MRIYQHGLRLSGCSLVEKRKKTEKAIEQAFQIGKIIKTTVKIIYYIKDSDKISRYVLTKKPNHNLRVESNSDFMELKDEDSVTRLFFYWDSLLSVSITTAR